MKRIIAFIDGMSLIDFKKDLKTQDAVIRNFEVIGEAAKNIPSNLKDQYPEVPWDKMYGLRNIVSHEYFGVDLNLIYTISTTQLPDNLAQVQQIISKETPDS